jgi:cell wall-associated NlpC family hydrolase
MITQAQRRAVVAEAMSWRGTPYHHRARVKGVGVDCGQILCAVYEASGVVGHIDPGEYSPQWHIHWSEEVYLQWVQRYCNPLPEGTPEQPGDIRVYKYGRCYAHGAIVVDDGLLLHSYIRRGVIVTAPHEEPLCGRPFLSWTIK